MVGSLRSVNAAIFNSLAPSTWANYNAVWSLWCAYLNSLNVPCNYFSETLVLSFLDDLMQHSYSSHLVKILAGISFFSKSQGFTPCSSLFLIKQALKGYHKRCFHSDTRVPVTLHLLRHLMSASSSVCYMPYEDLLFKVSLSLLFFGAFRISELLPRFSASSDGLLFSDISMGPDSIRIFLRFSKANQLGKGRWIAINQSPESSICVLSWLSKYLISRPCGSSQLLLHSFGVPPTQRQFSAVLAKCLKCLILNNWVVGNQVVFVLTLGLIYVFSDFRFATSCMAHRTLVHLLG